MKRRWRRGSSPSPSRTGWHRLPELGTQPAAGKQRVARCSSRASSDEVVARRRCPDGASPGFCTVSVTEKRRAGRADRHGGAGVTAVAARSGRATVTMAPGVADAVVAVVTPPPRRSGRRRRPARSSCSAAWRRGSSRSPSPTGWHRRQRLGDRPAAGQERVAARSSPRRATGSSASSTRRTPPRPALRTVSVTGEGRPGRTRRRRRSRRHHGRCQVRPGHGHDSARRRDAVVGLALLGHARSGRPRTPAGSRRSGRVPAGMVTVTVAVWLAPASRPGTE